MAKFMKLDVGEESYYIGFSSRASVMKAVHEGLEKDIRNVEKADSSESTSKIIRYGMLEKQPNITTKEVEDIINRYVDENIDDESCVDISQIITFIGEQYQAFSGLPTGKKKIKKLEIVEM